MTRELTLRYPPHAHTPTDPVGRCQQHVAAPGQWRATPTDGRMWRVTGNEVVADSRHGRLDWGLVPGTLLRLDGEVSQVFRDGYFGANGDYTITTRFFCVLDGAMAGTCWEAVGVEDMQDPANVLWDRVERL